MSIVSPDLRSVPPGATALRSWQESLRRAVRCPRALLRRLGIADQGQIVRDADFPVFVPEEFLARMQYGNPRDPLLRQVLSTGAETQHRTGYSHDPLVELEAQPVPGLIRKYQSRVLLILSGACAVHCRYCFRREFPYSETQISASRWEAALDSIRCRPEIKEVIYSGGDPLILGDGLLARLTAELATIPHVRALRIHSRLPVVIPHRLEESALEWMSSSGLVTTLVIHSNHAHELDGEVAGSMQRARASGITVLNQSVLLRGVNDTIEALAELSWRLIEIGAIPYYLHQLDRIQGAAHFAVPLARGMSLMQRLRNELPGYAVPRYAMEEPGLPAKTILL